MYTVVPSAKSTVKNLDVFGRLLMRSVNKIGPNIDLSGTPQEISSSEGIEVNCFIPLR